MEKCRGGVGLTTNKIALLTHPVFPISLSPHCTLCCNLKQPLPPMEAQQPPPPSTLNYPDSVDSSPRSRNSWDEPYPPKLRLMCSYGGHIVPRPHDKSLCYAGGDTRIVVVDRHTSLSDLSCRLSKSFLNARPFILKYQLPTEDLDSLVSLTTDEDFQNMIDEYDNRIAADSSSNSKPSRIRLFLFPIAQAVGPVGSGLTATAKSEEWFLNALSGGSGSLDGGLSDSASVNCLLGLEDESGNTTITTTTKILKQDVQSVPDSPMLETNSSFGSTSSSLSPSGANLPPKEVKVENGGVGIKVQNQKGVGIEEQFAQLGVGQKLEESIVAPSVPAVTSDEDHGVPVEYRKPPISQIQTQIQQKSVVAVDLASPDSASSDTSVSNAMSHPKTVIYQDQVQIQSVTSEVPSSIPVDPKLNVYDPHGQIQTQQHVQESGYILQPQFDQQQLLQPQQQPHQLQQFMHETHLIHHTATGPVPVPSGSYPVYQQQFHPQHHHHIDQQYPVYLVPARQSQAYNLFVHQANIAESASNFSASQLQNLPNPSAHYPMRNAPLPKSEIAAGVYRTPAATPQLVQVSPNKHQQYVAYSQINHPPSQSVAPNSAVPSSYSYDYADPAHAQVFYAQPLVPSMSSQYQTMTAAPAVLPEVFGQLPANSMRQQVRTSQPL
ncbi:hypothetical protein RJT34_16168 [Clitoria ternatea]|uniref:PB1 domain-containing protein n=1 Tax=Clitoria ternatea TaxID=43366 RepID=A0AAN9J6P8_CLITE